MSLKDHIRFSSKKGDCFTTIRGEATVFAESDINEDAMRDSEIVIDLAEIQITKNIYHLVYKDLKHHIDLMHRMLFTVQMDYQVNPNTRDKLRELQVALADLEKIIQP